MKTVQLGGSGLLVSRLFLGTMNFGWTASEDDSFAIMDRALELGINFFDTANNYGAQNGAFGQVESIVGRWLERTGRRDQVVLATKVYQPRSDWPNDGGLSARHIRLACEDSLRRLGTDYIDVYQMHHVDRSVPWDEIWQAMEQLVREGKVIYVGSSNFAGWHIAQACEQARRRNFLGLVSEQSYYNLAERRVELEVLPACQTYGLGLVAYSPLHGGLLAGKMESASGRRGDEGLRSEAERRREQLEGYAALCAELGESPAAVGLAWLLAQPAITAPVVGPRTIDQLESAVRAVEVQLDTSTLGRLDELFPGPGPAPEAYAW
jgi:aryl-alcohol dehydrogenase-like predicted oxidoreductase